MSLTALDLSPEELKKYRPREAVRRRRAETRVDVAKRRRRAQSRGIPENKIRRKGSDPVRVTGAARKFYALFGY